MSDLRFFSKAFMADFIELYKSYPCLWKTKSVEYKDRNKKDTAYTVLLKKLQELEPNATNKTVRAKINSIRGSFRREMKKIEDSKRSGAGADEIYQTHLWYYDLLLFTKDQEMPRASISNLVDNREGESESEQETDDEGENTQEMEHVADDVESLMSPPTRCMSRSSVTSDRNQPMSSPSTSSAVSDRNHNQHISFPSTSSAISTRSKRKRKTKVDEQADDVLTMVGERLRNNTTNDDALSIFGKHIAAKLRTFPKETKLYTEKLINDLLFEAEMGNINKNTKIVTLPNAPTNLIIDTALNANNYIVVDGSPGNCYNPHLQSNEYSRPVTDRPTHQHQNIIQPQHHNIIQPQHQIINQPHYHNLQRASAMPHQPDPSIAQFFGSYQPPEANNQ